MMAQKAVVIKVVLIGNSGCGKTSLMQQYVNKKFNLHYKSTIGADFLSKELFVDGRNVLLQIWDTAGQETFRSLGSAFYRGADGCVLVFDVTNKYTFDCISGWKDNFLRTTTNSEDSEGKFAAFILVGNKIDLRGTSSSSSGGDSLGESVGKRVSKEAAQVWCEQHEQQLGKVPYYETSAATAENVDAAFLSLVRETLRRYDDIASSSGIPHHDPETIQLKRSKKKPAEKEPEEKAAGCGC